MKKLKLEELEVRSLTTSVESQEETKGGTTPVCIATGLSVIIVGGMTGAAAYFGSY